MNPTEAQFIINITPNKLREMANEMEYYEKNCIPGQTITYKVSSNFAFQYTTNNLAIPIYREQILRTSRGNA